MLWDRFFNFGIPIDYKVEKSVNQNLLIDQKVEKAFNYLIDDLFFNQLNLSFLTFDFLSHSNFWIDWKVVINSTRMEIIQHKKLIALRYLRHTCFKVFATLGQFGGIRPKYPKRT